MWLMPNASRVIKGLKTEAIKAKGGIVRLWQAYDKGELAAKGKNPPSLNFRILRKQVFQLFTALFYQLSQRRRIMLHGR